MIGTMVDDVMGETRARALSSGVDSPEAVRCLGRPLVSFSAGMAEDLARLRQFLYTRMYRSHRVNRTRTAARRILRELFALFMEESDVLPGEWFERLQGQDDSGRARVVCDYIAGMTDRYAIEEHRRLYHMDVWH